MITLTNIATRIVTSDEDGLSFAIKAEVLNRSDDPDVYLEVQGVDAEGFVIYSVYLDGNVPVGTGKTLTTLEECVNLTVFEQIVTWQTK